VEHQDKGFLVLVVINCLSLNVSAVEEVGPEVPVLVEVLLAAVTEALAWSL
jgi:hypothetical protein